MPIATEGKLIKLYHIGDEVFGYKCIGEFDPDVKLRGSYSHYGNICPQCGSDDVCVLSRKFNTYSSWYCQLCHIRWEHVSLSCPICNHFRINYKEEGGVVCCSKCRTQWNLNDLLIQINETYY